MQDVDTALVANLTAYISRTLNLVFPNSTLLAVAILRYPHNMMVVVIDAVR